MKKFLLIVGGLLLTALLTVIAVFCYLSYKLQASQSTTSETVTVQSGAVQHESTTGIPLRDLPLSDAQQSVLEKVGVDVETFEITPAMQACAETSLGSERMAEIIAGDAPTMIETTKLMGCL